MKKTSASFRKDAGVAKELQFVVIYLLNISLGPGQDRTFSSENIGPYVFSQKKGDVSQRQDIYEKTRHEVPFLKKTGQGQVTLTLRFIVVTHFF